MSFDWTKLGTLFKLSLGVAFLLLFLGVVLADRFKLWSLSYLGIGLALTAWAAIDTLRRRNVS